MGCSSAKAFTENGVMEDESNLPREFVIWLDLLESFPFRDSEKDKKKRDELWKSASKGQQCSSYENSNEMVLNNFKIPKISQDKELIKKSYDMAKKQGKTDAGLAQEQFRDFFVFLRQYHEYFLMFEYADKNGDKRISYEEFVLAIPVIEHWGGKVEDPQTCFDNIDTSKDKTISFEEFCVYAINSGLQLQNQGNEPIPEGAE